MFKIGRKTTLTKRNSPVVTRSVTRNYRNLISQVGEPVRNKMAQASTNGIPKFSGESDDISIDDYIAHIQRFIINKGIQSEDQKIQVFKANINLEKGTARQIIKCREFEEDIKHYNKYLSEFRKHFAHTSASEPLRILVKYLKIQRQDNETITEYICKLDNFTKQIEKIAGTQWAVSGHPEHIHVKVLNKLLMMAKVVADSKGSMTDTKLMQINYLIKGYLEKDLN